VAGGENTGLLTILGQFAMLNELPILDSESTKFFKAVHPEDSCTGVRQLVIYFFSYEIKEISVVCFIAYIGSLWLGQGLGPWSNKYTEHGELRIL
jgi:hypothetical protein